MFTGVLRNELFENQMLYVLKQNAETTAFNGFDQTIFALKSHVHTETLEMLVNNLENNSVILDNVSFFQAFPQQSLIPMANVFNVSEVQYIPATQQIEGRIGFNLPTFDIFEQFVATGIGTYQGLNKKQISVPQLVVLFKNDMKFQHVSAVILSDITIYGFEHKFEADQLPEQFIVRFVQKGIEYKDYKFEEQKKYNQLFKDPAKLNIEDQLYVEKTNKLA